MHADNRAGAFQDLSHSGSPAATNATAPSALRATTKSAVAAGRRWRLRGQGTAPSRASMAGASPCPCDALHRRRFRRTRKPASRDTKPACGRSLKPPVCGSHGVLAPPFSCRPRSGRFRVPPGRRAFVSGAAGEAPNGVGRRPGGGRGTCSPGRHLAAPQAVADGPSPRRLSWPREAHPENARAMLHDVADKRRCAQESCKTKRPQWNRGTAAPTGVPSSERGGVSTGWQPVSPGGALLINSRGTTDNEETSCIHRVCGTRRRPLRGGVRAFRGNAAV